MLHEVRAPDGTVIQVEAPDGASQEDIIAFAQKNYQRTATTQDRAQAAASGFNKGALSYLPGLPVKTALDVADLARAGYGAASQALGMPVSSMPDLINRESIPMSPEWIQSKIRDYGGGRVIDPNVPNDPTSRILHAGGVAVGSAPIPGQMAKQAVSGALAQAAQEVGASPEVATIAGMAPFAGSAFTPRQRAPTPQTIMAERERVPLTTGQMTGSPTLRTIEGTLAQTPGSAGVYANLRERQLAAFNEAANRRIGEPGRQFERDVGTTIANNFTDKYNQAVAGRTVVHDKTLLTDLANVETRYMRNLSPDQKGIVTQYLDDILNLGQKFSGEDYQIWRSRIGERAYSTTDTELKGALKGIQKALDSAFVRSQSQEGAQPMIDTRAQYRNWKTLKPLIEDASLTGGDLSPLKVRGRAKATHNVGGDMGQLAELGQVIGKEYPNSGTPTRSLIQKIITQSPTNWTIGDLFGVTGMPYLAARTLQSKAMQGLLTGASRFGPTSQQEELLRRYGGLLGYSASR